MEARAGSGDVGYTESNGVEIGYRVLGEGERAIVRVPGLLFTIDELDERPELARLAFGPATTWGRLVVFDRRGQGVSGRSFGFGTAEDRMDDIRAVMDAADVERAVLLAHGDGASFALLFAATYPERVTSLVLRSVAAPRTRWAPDYPIGNSDDVLAHFEAWVLANWGNGRTTRLFTPEVYAMDPARAASGERRTCSPRTAAEQFRLASDLDVRAALPTVSAPAIVVHGTDDFIPVAWARYLTDHLANATLLDPPGVGLDGPAHEANQLWDAIEEFVTGERPQHAADIDRVLATVLFVDIVESTEHLAAMGDQAWATLLDRFRVLVRKEVARFSGREINTRGDDVLATFDGSTRAVRCAAAIVETARRLGVEVRAGLHTGEVEHRDDDVAGLAVHVGARVSALAGPSEVLVTATLRDLTAGSGLEYVDRGTHMLKGVPGEYQLLALARA